MTTDGEHVRHARQVWKFVWRAIPCEEGLRSKRLRLTEGPRPKLTYPGIRLYCGNHPLVHVNLGDTPQEETPAPSTTLHSRARAIHRR